MDILNQFNLVNKVALVTGAAQGIGKSIALALSAAGAKVVLVDQNTKILEQTHYEFRQQGLTSIAVRADVRKKIDIENMLAETLAKWGRLDIAINNAGVGGNASVEATTEEQWDTILDVNLKGVFRCCQAQGQPMFAQGSGVIVNIASMSGLIVPHPQKQVAYNTSKAGVIQLTKTLACEWASKGIRVNCISPGIVDTPLINTTELSPLKQEWLTQNPMGRLASVDDISGGVVFLASAASKYITGHNLVIDGGHTVW